MRARRLAASIIFLAPLAITACSLLVSTSDLTGPGALPTPSSEGGTATEASNGVDGSPAQLDATSDADAALSEPHLIAAWTFDEGSGIVANDVTGRGHSADLKGGATFVSTGCRYGGCVELHGSGDAEGINVTSTDAEDFPKAGTFSIWFRWRVAPGADTATGLLDGWDPNRNHLFLRHANGDAPEEFQFAAQPKSNSYTYAAYFKNPKDAWCHVVLTWSAATQMSSLYVNAVNINTGLYNSNLGAFSPTQQDFFLGYYLQGNIDDVRLYDAVLDDAAIKAIP